MHSNGGPERMFGSTFLEWIYDRIERAVKRIESFLSWSDSRVECRKCEALNPPEHVRCRECGDWIR